MAVYDRMLEIIFRILNIPFSLTGYSSFITSISLLTSMWTCSKYFEDLVLNPNPNSFPYSKTNTEFDFIVVGAGSAGSVISNRLSESGRYRVLLLEAGGDPSPYNRIPSFAPFNLHLTTDWNYRTEPQKDSCFSVDEQKMLWPRGKVVGGSSQLNFMIYMRGHPKDFELWANMSGDASWRYENLLPVFKKSENYMGNWPDSNFHGSGGPLPVTKQSYQPSLDYWLAAGKELGFDATTDPNSYQPASFSAVDVTIFKGMRAGTYESFIKPILKRKNLQIYRFAHVTKIEIDDQLRATGVTYVRDGRILSATARKEIVISAGAIGTPQLLMLSGIGPAAHLLEHGVNHSYSRPSRRREKFTGPRFNNNRPFFTTKNVSFIFDRDFSFNTLLQYELNRTGPISSNIVSGLAMISSSLAEPDWPDIQLHITGLGIRAGAAEDLTVCFGLKPHVLLELLSPYKGLDANFVLVDLGRPKSAGFIELKSKDPFIHPKIDPRYFEHPDDMKAMIDGIKFVVKLYEETSTYQSLGAKLASKPLPGCDHLPFKSDMYYECYTRHLTMTIYHPCCTARFGHENDPMAVLDSKLRVKGVKGLRVADASSMPMITNANLNAPTIMIGERASELILELWDSKNENSES